MAEYGIKRTELAGRSTMLSGVVTDMPRESLVAEVIRLNNEQKGLLASDRAIFSLVLIVDPMVGPAATPEVRHCEACAQLDRDQVATVMHELAGPVRSIEFDGKLKVVY